MLLWGLYIDPRYVVPFIVTLAISAVAQHSRSGMSTSPSHAVSQR